MSSALDSIPQESHGRFEAFRNIATCSPTQHLFDDLGDEDDFAILQFFDNFTSGIDHGVPPQARFQQYGHIENSLLCFDEKFWSWGRFGRKNYGVWYGALEEETSVLEALHHRPEIDKNDLMNSRDPIIQARKMFRAQLDSEIFMDLRPHVRAFPKIAHITDYEFCQALGAEAVKRGVGMFLAPSVRNPGGTCTPVFDVKVIQRDQAIRTYFFHFPLDGSEPYHSRSEKI